MYKYVHIHWQASFERLEDLYLQTIIIELKELNLCYVYLIWGCKTSTGVFSQFSITTNKNKHFSKFKQELHLQTYCILYL